MRRKIIVAMDENGLIGNGNKIPWRIPEEFKFFKDVTMGCPVIMGRKTWESLPKKPLPGRKNIIMSRGAHTPVYGSHIDNDNVIVVDNWDAAFKAAAQSLSLQDDSVFIIGGAQIYKEALEKDYVDSIIISEVKGKYEGDTYFPTIDSARWRKTLIFSHEQFTVYEYEPKPIATVCEKTG